MIPILYGADETAFSTNGLGRLKDCISCVVTEERNGIYECDFEYPVNGLNFDNIQCGRIIAVIHDDTGDLQPFDIVSYSKPLDGVVSFHAVHISYRQSKITVSGTGINSLADAFTALRNSTPDNPFTYSTDKGSTGYVSAFDGIPRSVRSLLGGVEGSILDAYGGEYEWNKFNVILHGQRGQKRDFKIRYGVNLSDYTEEADFAESYNAVIPFWSGGDDEFVSGSVVYSGFPTVNGRDEVVPLDLSDKFENAPTTGQLEAMASSYMRSNQTYLPSNTISVDFLRDNDEYANFASLYACSLCDTIELVFPKYNISGNFKIVKTVYNVLLERYESMELGNLSTSLSEALGISSGESKASSQSFEWTLIKTVTGTPSSTIDLSDYKEVLVTCKILGGTVPRFASVVIPKNMIESAYKEWSVGFSSSASSAVFGALFRLSLTNFTPQWAYANGTNLSSTSEWNLYAR